MRILLLLGLGLCSSLVAADEVADSHDLPAVPRFPRAQLVDYSQVASQERILPAGPIRRISGQLRFEAEVASQGQLTALTYELPREHTALEAFAAARSNLQQQGASLLYWCEGRDCGSSNLWANNVFANSQLYGADEQQAYALLRLAAPADNSLLALYGITRGNRRSYLHIEQLDAAAPLGVLLPNPATLLRELRTAGSLSLAQLSDAPQEPWLQLLVRTLNLDSSLRVSVFGAQAEAWRQALLAQGILPARLELGGSTGTGLQLKVMRP